MQSYRLAFVPLLLALAARSGATGSTFNALPQSGTPQPITPQSAARATALPDAVAGPLATSGANDLLYVSNFREQLDHDL